MKVAVVGDIHSNSVALSAFYHEVERQCVDGFIYTGDFVSDCAYPEKTLSLLQEYTKKYPSFLVRGNRETYLQKHHENPDDGWCYDSQTGSMLYTYENLTSGDLEFLFALQETLQEKDFFLMHGSPASAVEAMYPEHESTKAYVLSSPCPLIICGHSHQQFVYEFEDRILLNPGSLGIPVHGNPNAQFAVVEWKNGNHKITLQELPYNYQQAVREIAESGLEEKSLYWAKCIMKTLQTGKSYIPKCFKLAQSLAESDRITCKGLVINPAEADKLVFNPQYIPQKYWEKAAKQLDIA